MGNKTIDAELSIIIVSFNTREMTLECLRSIHAQTLDVAYEIILVDNDSKDDSVNAIRAEFPDVRLIALAENIGFARANNLAAKEARGNRILLLNPDTVILDRAIDRLAAFANNTPLCRIWGGRTVFKDGSLNPYSCSRRMTLWSLACSVLGLTYMVPSSSIFSPESYGGWERNTVQYVDIVSGCFLMIDRALWNQLGGFDPAFFMYGEEADLCLRARKAGARPIVTPDATIVHYEGASATSVMEKRITSCKGKVTLIYRHWSPLSRPFGRTLFMNSGHTLVGVPACGTIERPAAFHPTGQRMADAVATPARVDRRLPRFREMTVLGREPAGPERRGRFPPQSPAH